MKYKESYEQEVEFNVLIVKILKKWRFILGCVICFAILLGGVQLNKAIKEIRSYSAQEVQEKYNKELELYKENASNITNVIQNAQKNLANKQEYVENSIKMRIDPIQECVSSADVMVTVNSTNPRASETGFTEKILNTYMGLVMSDQIMDKVKEGLDEEIDVQYIRELITLTFNKSTFSFNIKLIHSDQESGKKILEIILEELKENQSKVGTTFGVHGLEITNRTDYLMVDNALDNFQKSTNDLVTNLQNTITSNNRALIELEEPAKDDLGLSIPSIILKVMIHLIVGGILGAVFGFFIIFVNVNLKDDIYDPETLRIKYDLKYLGSLPLKKQMKNKIDSMIESIENKSGISLSAEEENRLVAINLLNYSPAGDPVLLVGPAGEEELLTIQNRMKAGVGLQQKEKSIDIAPAVFTNPDSAEKLQAYKDIVLVGIKGKTLYSEIDKTVQYLNDLGKNIVGIVLE